MRTRKERLPLLGLDRYDNLLSTQKFAPSTPRAPVDWFNNLQTGAPVHGAHEAFLKGNRLLRLGFTDCHAVTQMIAKVKHTLARLNQAPRSIVEDEKGVQGATT